MLTKPMPFSRFTGRALIAGALMGATSLAACNQDKLLTVPTPDVVLPKDITGAAALPSAYASAIGDFQIAYAGGDGKPLDYNQGLPPNPGPPRGQPPHPPADPPRPELGPRATD